MTSGIGIFSCVYWPHLPWRNVYSDHLFKILGDFLIIELEEFFFNILDTSPLPAILFANIFPHFVGCLFVFLMVSFAA